MRNGTESAWAWIRILPLFLLIIPANVQGQERVDHVTVQLVSEEDSIQPGRSFKVAVSMGMEPGWHVYWQNPGDSGAPPRITWRLPDGFEAGAVIWPYPERIEAEPLATFGYHGDLLLMAWITPPDTLKVGDRIAIEARVEWLVCKEACLPGEAVLSLTLPVELAMPRANKDWSDAFIRTEARIPRINAQWKIRPSIEEGKILLALHPPEEFENRLFDVVFFPYENGLIENAAPQMLSQKQSGYEPHMYVINREGTLVYAGAIDSIRSTKAEDVASATNYVKEALDASMAGGEVKTKTSAPYGCSVKY